MEELKILRGNKENLPKILDKNNIYVATSDVEGDYSSIYINGKEYVSKEYIDNIVNDIEKLLNEL